VGKNAQDHRGILKLKYAMKEGVVQNWGDMEKIWSHAFSKDMLNISTEEHPVHHFSVL
jgi:centractin